MRKKNKQQFSKDPRSIQRQQHHPGNSSNRTVWWQAVLLPIAAILIFFGLLEGGLALFGVKPALKTEDPFVGFSSNVPLFVPAPDSQGRLMLQTAQNKLRTFNQQSFPRTKAPGSYRIFTLGGSTTYGRPYNDVTSFSGWLRELLPETDRDKNWEVINAGGISYASYRVAHLMEELVDYQPDLFVIYTGHNEFLEERTYGKIKQIPGPVRTTISLLAQTRTWSVMNTGLKKTGLTTENQPSQQDNLGVEVDAILDSSAGLDRYTRDEPLRQKILEHYRISLERMVALARSVDARIIFVTPAANLKDSTPFKSQHTAKLDPQTAQRAEQLLGQAKGQIDQQNWTAALELLDQAAALDPDYAAIQFRRGQALAALNRRTAAAEAFRTARDEDVCPLRALTPMPRLVKEVAREQNIRVVDFVEFLRQRMAREHGIKSPGDEYFLDHVHPTIEGHKLLAVELVKAMAAEGVVQPRTDWQEQAVASASQRIDSRIDDKTHGQALANLARVLFWAGKDEGADRLARQAHEIAGEKSLQVYVDSASILTSVALRAGRLQEAVDRLYQTLERAPGAVEIRRKLGQTLASPRFMQLEQAAANLLLVCQQMPTHHVAFSDLGFVMARRGRLEVAQDILNEALRLNPKNVRVSSTLKKLENIIRQRDLPPQKPMIMLDIYPSQAPREIVQIYRTSEGRPITHGIKVTFHENGRLKHFVDTMRGQKSGFEMLWDDRGQLLSRNKFIYGQPVTGKTAQ